MKKISDAFIEEVYVDLELNHCGKENAVKRSEYAAQRGLTEREMRLITHEINDSRKYRGIVSTTSALYICNDKAECLKTMANSYKHAFTLLHKARVIENKIHLNGQFELTDDDYKLIQSCYFTPPTKDEIEEIKKNYGKL